MLSCRRAAHEEMPRSWHRSRGLGEKADLTQNFSPRPAAWREEESEACWVIWRKETSHQSPTFKRQFQTELCVGGGTLQKASLRYLRDRHPYGPLQPGGWGGCSLGQLLALPLLHCQVSLEASMIQCFSLQFHYYALLGHVPNPLFCWQVWFLGLLLQSDVYHLFCLLLITILFSFVIKTGIHCCESQKNDI